MDNQAQKEGSRPEEQHTHFYIIALNAGEVVDRIQEGTLTPEIVERALDVIEKNAAAIRESIKPTTKQPA